jgi:hypothetical protein
MILKTRHTGLVVKDISASIAFYEGLGLKVWKHEVEKGDYLMDHYWSYSNINLIQQSLLLLNTNLIITGAHMWLLPFRMFKKFLLKLFSWAALLLTHPRFQLMDQLK